MTGTLFEIVHEDDELLVINKPADLVCHPTKGDEMSSLISRVRLHLGQAAAAHMINRLDRETTGIVLLAMRDVAAVDPQDFSMMPEGLVLALKEDELRDLVAYLRGSRQVALPE